MTGGRVPDRWDDPQLPTPPLDELRAILDADDNVWWIMGCGHHQNGFDAACERIDELTAQLVDSAAQAVRHAATVAEMIAAYRRFDAAATDKLAEYGWVPFGWHANDVPAEQVEFSAQRDEDGLPFFERAVRDA